MRSRSNVSGRPMGPLGWVAQNLGLVSLTLVCVVLTFYLVYCMIHPERF